MSGITAVQTQVMSPSVHYQHAIAWITSVGSRDYSSMAAYMHKDFTHCFLPASLHGFGKPVRSGQEFIDHVRSLESTFERLNFLPPKDVVEGEDAVVLHFASDGILAGGKPYSSEYVFIFRFKDGKILSVKEFMDSGYILSMIGAESRED